MAKENQRKGSKKASKKMSKKTSKKESSKTSKVIKKKPKKPIAKTTKKEMSINLEKHLPRIKRRLSEKEEFDIMKLVLDKFLWIGAALMGWGLFRSLMVSFTEGFWYIFTGALVMIAFAWVIIKEFERIR